MSGTPSHTHARRQATRARMLAAGVLILVVLLALDMGSGAAPLTWSDVWRHLIRPGSAGTTEHFIVWNLRLPQALMAILAGAALGLAGAEMQTVLDNPLASPFTLGVSSAAALGAALSLSLGIHIPGVAAQHAVAANAFVLALFCSLLLDHAARRLHMAQQGIVLLGIALVFGFNALLSLIQLLSDAASLQNLLYWMMGSLGGVNWGDVVLLAVVFVITASAAHRQAWSLTALRFGEERAGSLGIDTRRVRRWALMRVSVLAATSVALVGVIGFVGLIAPHIARRLCGEDHRWYLPASACTGAIILLGASVCAKQLSSNIEIPVGIVTTLVGIPFFILVLSRRRLH
ncbi:MAG TPA: iron ABC transporter permease [Burkholderiaceae bacterium]|nr:iron ABC transporter permease [Burkholderiaceae bacterium]